MSLFKAVGLEDLGSIVRLAVRQGHADLQVKRQRLSLHVSDVLFDRPRITRELRGAIEPGKRLNQRIEQPSERLVQQLSRWLITTDHEVPNAVIVENSVNVLHHFGIQCLSTGLSIELRGLCHHDGELAVEVCDFLRQEVVKNGRFGGGLPVSDGGILSRQGVWGKNALDREDQLVL